MLGAPSRLLWYFWGREDASASIVSTACLCDVQETDRGRHDKRSLNQGFYSIPFDPLKTMPC